MTDELLGEIHNGLKWLIAEKLELQWQNRLYRVWGEETSPDFLKRAEEVMTRADNDDRSEAQVARMIEGEEAPKGRVP